MSRAFTFIGLGLIALYLFDIGAVATGAKLDQFAAIMYLSQLVIWVSLAVFWQWKATKRDEEKIRDWRR